MTEDLLHIHRLQLDYHITSGEASAQATGARLDKVFSRNLETGLGPVFDGLRRHGDGLWFIRRLEVDFDCDLELNDGEIGQRWIRRLGQGLARCMTAEHGESVRYFPDHAHYLACFLSDLARGNAWQHWYYREFDGLRPLPAPAALRAALLRQPEQGLQALQQLARADRTRVLNALGPGEARRSLFGLAGGVQAPLPQAVIDTLFQFLQHPGRTPILISEPPWVAALDLYLHGVAEHPASAGPALANLCLPLRQLQDQWPMLSTEQRQRIEQALQRGARGSLYSQFPPSLVERLQPLFELPTAARDSLRQQLTSASEPTQKVSESDYTPFGGLFFLLPQLARLPLDECTVDWPALTGRRPATVLRLLLMAQCLGRFFNTFRDPLLQELVGIHGTIGLADVKDWLREIPQSAVQQTQQRLIAQRLATLRYPAIHYFTVNQRHRLLGIAAEQQRGSWLMLRGCRRRQMRPFLKALDRLLPKPGIVSADTAGDQCGKDLRTLQLPDTLACPAPLAALLTCLAQNLLRDFACRLPGFARSSLAYLQLNFLDLDARLRRDDECDIVELGRPPLNLVLAVTGMGNQHYTLPWRDHPLTLHQSG